MANPSASSETLEGDEAKRERSISPFIMAAPRSRSSDALARIRVKNRRKRYLDTHPEYFSSNLELADPLAYDRLVRRFQTKANREAEGRRKGYSGVLEADLWRSEAKIDALADPGNSGIMTYKRGADGEILAEEKDEVPANKAEGMQRWRKEMELRFLRGQDGDFDYTTVDESEEYDDRSAEEREEEEKWFAEEEPEWMVGEDNNHPVATHLKGETGVQDY
ncbi:MAG: hypothetical protein FRX48_02118 [Lasallia pustulata]|uniref:CCD97-like C-terminal domain-containing protein n=1 Tax=Lasallia pustulata TaxID=136370 RepID=A0A5M8PVV5_9LECA|nr:MAG: hypothetical protein FRX48_02118 [Lasallia pustulata]